MDEEAMNLGSRTKIRGNSHLYLGPRTFEIENWSGVRGFDAYPQRQSVTESININSLADHHIWSTIKTLPATLPEPAEVRVSRAKPLQQSDWNLRPRISTGGY